MEISRILQNKKALLLDRKRHTSRHVVCQEGGGTPSYSDVTPVLSIRVPLCPPRPDHGQDLGRNQGFDQGYPPREQTNKLKTLPPRNIRLRAVMKLYGLLLIVVKYYETVEKQLFYVRTEKEHFRLKLIQVTKYAKSAKVSA